VREKVRECLKTLADKDMQIFKMDSEINLLKDELEFENNQTKDLNAEIDRIVDTYNRTGRLPIE